MLARREVGFNGPVEFSEIVARHGSVHMVLNVIVHLPIHEPHDRVEGKSATAEAEVVDVILETDVLRTVAEQEKPLAVEWREGDQDRREPPLEIKGNKDDESVADEQGPCPDDRCVPGLRIIVIKRMFPLALEFSAGDAAGSLESVPKPDRVHEALGEKAFQQHTDRQYHFEVIRRMEGIAMVTHVAFLKHLEIDPAEEREHTDEKLVERLGLKHCSMAKFMHSVN